MKDILEQFDVRTESGKTLKVIVSADRINTDTFESQGWMHGLKEYRLATGGALNRTDDNTFVIVSTGERATRIR